MIKPKKSLGQNFLVDNNIIDKIIKLSNIENNNILEIGPGTGNLTKRILNQKPKSLHQTSFELKSDSNSIHIPIVAEEFGFPRILKAYNDFPRDPYVRDAG